MSPNVIGTATRSPQDGRLHLAIQYRRRRAALPRALHSGDRCVMARCPGRCVGYLVAPSLGTLYDGIVEVSAGARSWRETGLVGIVEVIAAMESWCWSRGWRMFRLENDTRKVLRGRGPFRQRSTI
jgi:hypothetical protein